MIKERNTTDGFDERDVAAAIESLKSAPFKGRFIRTDCNAADPVWKAPDGQPVKDHVHDQMKHFRKEVETVGYSKFHNGVFQKYDKNAVLTITHHRMFEPFVPTPGDLLHVYGPDRDNIRDWQRYYRYAWKDKGPNGIFYSTDAQIIREGKLACNSYAYSGQNSFALVGAGMFFRPLFGNAKVSIRPYVQWLTSASFTGTESAPASATASLGIWVESWKLNGDDYAVDRDHWIPVWSQNTQSYMTNVAAGGAATVSDGLATEITAVTQRKYAIYVYVYLETTAGPQQHKNELRFVTLDIDAVIPYVAVQEKLL
jgi:hypothetical protein